MKRSTKKILVFGASTSSTSINKQLANFAGGLLKKTDFLLIDLNDYPMPIYSIDEEKVNGFSKKTKEFAQLFKDFDGFIISLAEHNGSFTTAFKNMFDWLSRIDIKFFQNKPLLLMATSPGSRGGRSVLDHASACFLRHGTSKIVSFSLPNFYTNFEENKVKHINFLEDLKEKVISFESLL